MKAEIGRSAKIENDQNENPTTFCDCFLWQSVAASAPQVPVYIFEQKFQSRFSDMGWETQPQSLSLEEEQMTWWGPRGGGETFGDVANYWWSLSSLSVGNQLWKKSHRCEVGENWYSSTHCRIGFTAPGGSLPYFFRLSTRAYLPSTPRWTLYSNPWIAHCVEKYCTLQIGCNTITFLGGGGWVGDEAWQRKFGI